MTVDARGRSAADALRRTAPGEVEAREMLDRLSHRKHPLVRARTLALGGLAALVILGAAFAWSTVRPQASAPPVSPAPHGPDNRAFPLAVPFTADVPHGWLESGHAGVTATLTAPSASNGYTEFVEVVVDPQPIVAAPAPGGSPDPTPEHLTAKTLAEWMAKRPYLQPTAVVATTLGGRPAWQLDIRLRTDAAATQHCDNGPADCVAMIRLPSVALPLGPSHGGAARVICVEMTNGRIVGVVASGDANNVAGLLGDTRPFLESIRFNAP